MKHTTEKPHSTSNATRSSGDEGQGFILGLWGVRYQVKDISRAVTFYTEQLGFKLDHQNLPAFAQVSIANLKLILSGPGASGSRPMPATSIGGLMAFAGDATILGEERRGSGVGGK